MKKVYLVIALLAASYSWAQQNIPASIYPYLSDVVKEHLTNTAPPFTFSELKNNSFDGPTKIEEYYVDLSDIPHLDRVFEYTYTSAGRLTQVVEKDASLQNLNRNTYNFTWFGKTESVITEGWNGSNWEFTYRKQYTYTAGQNINTITYEAFNGSSWVISEIDRFSYLGGETTPHRSLLEASNDGITWTPYVAIDYTYTGTLPHTLTVLYYDNNYLQFVPAEELVVQSWGNATFTADYLFDMDIEQFKITDQRTNKIQQMFNHPQKFEYHYGFTTANWTFQDTLIYDALLSNGKRIAQNLIEVNMGILDTIEKQNYLFDPCYGYKGTMYYSKDMGNNWVLSYGTDYQGQTVPYGNTCYVTAYNRYTNFSTLNPAGQRDYRWVITHAANLGNEEITAENISIYPNPTNNMLHIDNEDIVIETVKIVDLNGSIVFEADDIGGETIIDVHHLENGIYLVEVKSEFGTQIKRFVKN